MTRVLTKAKRKILEHVHRDSEDDTTDPQPLSAYAIAKLRGSNPPKFQRDPDRLFKIQE